MLVFCFHVCSRWILKHAALQPSMEHVEFLLQNYEDNKKEYNINITWNNSWPLVSTSNVRFCICMTLSLWICRCCSADDVSELNSQCLISSDHSSNWLDTCKGILSLSISYHRACNKWGLLEQPQLRVKKYLIFSYKMRLTFNILINLINVKMFSQINLQATKYNHF